MKCYSEGCDEEQDMFETHYCSKCRRQFDEERNEELKKNHRADFQVMKLYKHYKGGEYFVLGTALHTETDEQMVIYTGEKGINQIYVRPLKMFTDMFIGPGDGHLIPRFKRIT